VRNEIIRFVESQEAATVARFFNALGLELTVLTRISIQDKDGMQRVNSFNEMQHACFGQINAHLHDVADLFPAHASIAILYHYANEAKAVDDLEQAFSRALKLAMHGQAPPPSEVERRILLLAGDTQRATIHRVLSGSGIVFEADNGADALDKAEWVEPHLTIVDTATPGVDARDFINKFRRTPLGKNSKLLLLAGSKKFSAGINADAILKTPTDDEQIRDSALPLLELAKH
jgi:CheY-like chemotaxis protein